MPRQLPDPRIGDEPSVDLSLASIQRNFDFLSRLVIETGADPDTGQPRDIHLRFGSSTVEFSADPEATAEVNHGLARTPVAAFAFPVLATGQRLMASARSGADETSITFQFSSDDANNITDTFTFYWLALG